MERAQIRESAQFHQRGQQHGGRQEQQAEIDEEASDKDRRARFEQLGLEACVGDQDRVDRGRVGFHQRMASIGPSADPVTNCRR